MWRNSYPSTTTPSSACVSDWDSFRLRLFLSALAGRTDQRRRIALPADSLEIRGRPVLRWACIAFGVFMFFNGFGHMLGSEYFGTLIPGFWSSPFLIMTSSYISRLS